MNENEATKNIDDDCSYFEPPNPSFVQNRFVFPVVPIHFDNEFPIPADVSQQSQVAQFHIDRIVGRTWEAIMVNDMD
jgi:hypothetical protein